MLTVCALSHSLSLRAYHKKKIIHRFFFFFFFNLAFDMPDRKITLNLGNPVCRTSEA